MKQNQRKSSTLPQIFESPHQHAIGDLFEEWNDDDMFVEDYLKRPNPPTKEMIERAKFVDKTYVWNQK